MDLRLDVETPYPVVVGEELDIGETISDSLEPRTGVILTDSEVGPLYASSVRDSLESAGWRMVETIEVPAGESSKSLRIFGKVVETLAGQGLTRDSTLFALGGGVVGDLGGFVAGTYMRGVDLVMLPASLLAMVDSSVGGKVGVDLPEGKNLVGAFVRPRIVVADVGWLGTLPSRQVSNGLAEVIKMGLLSGGEYFSALEFLPKALSADTDALRELIIHAIGFKAAVVAGDERETGRRAILNYGHTIGHGLESAADYTLPHGEAVAVGMVAAANISRDVASHQDLLQLHQDLLDAAGLSSKIPSANTGEVLRAMSRDKKRRSSDGHDEHRFVLLEDVGRPVWGVPVGEDIVTRALEAIVG